MWGGEFWRPGANTAAGRELVLREPSLRTRRRDEEKRGLVIEKAVFLLSLELSQSERSHVWAYGSRRESVSSRQRGLGADMPMGDPQRRIQALPRTPHSLCHVVVECGAEWEEPGRVLV